MNFIWSLLKFIKDACVIAFQIAEVVLVLFVGWFVLAALVDLVSDANVDYQIPLWGMPLSFGIGSFCWLIAEGITKVAKNSVLKKELQREINSPEPGLEDLNDL